MKVVQNSILMLILAAGLSACGAKGNQTNVELIQDMMDSPSVKSQEYDEFFDDKAGGARVPPENTVPVGFKTYKAGFNPELAKADRNPLAGDMSDEVLLTGQKYYQTHCMVCHGQNGNGLGPVAEKMPNKPPSILTDKIRGWTDGQLYQVITMGQGTMGAYASHIPQKYRWQVVNYIRHLHKTEKQ
jgi:mono/diheme cytochrome c family protein